MKISELPKEVREKALEYQRNETSETLSKTTDDLKLAFLWHRTKEGRSYWLKWDMKKTKENETPEHYKTDNNIDVIDFCKIYNLNFNRGNIVKYVCRAGKKDDEIKDLKKALDYLQREIKYLENDR